MIRLLFSIIESEINIICYFTFINYKYKYKYYKYININNTKITEFCEGCIMHILIHKFTKHTDR